jgi:hypothetical protein
MIGYLHNCLFMRYANRMNKSGCRVVIVFVVFIIIIFVAYGGNRIEAFVDAPRCGVDLPSCVGEDVRCINGYCKSDKAPTLPPFSDLPIMPSL